MKKRSLILIFSFYCLLLSAQPWNIVRLKESGVFYKKTEIKGIPLIFLGESSGVIEHTGEYFNVSVNSSDEYFFNRINIETKSIKSIPINVGLGLSNLHYNPIDSSIYATYLVINEKSFYLVKLNIETGDIEKLLKLQGINSLVGESSGIIEHTGEYFNISVNSSEDFFFNRININTKSIISTPLNVGLGLSSVHYNSIDSNIYATYYELNEKSFYLVKLNIETGDIEKLLKLQGINSLVGESSGIIEHTGEYFNISVNSSEYFFNRININTKSINTIPIKNGLGDLHYSKSGKAIYARYYGLLPDTTITGINEQTTNSKISIYPNPSTGSFSLQLQQPLQNANLQITNSVGLVVYSQSYSSLQNATINTTEFSSGLYNISINNGNSTFSKKLVVY